MQIPSASWLNPAAGTTQALSQTRSDGTVSSNAAEQAKDLSVTDVEGAQKAGDRDANEQYLSQDQGTGDSHKKNQSQTLLDASINLVELPADDGQQNELDCWG